MSVSCERGDDDDDDDDEWEDTDEECNSEDRFLGDEDIGEGGEFHFADEETRSRFTDYSMTSSVMRRNEQLTLLDDRFEKVNLPLSSVVSPPYTGSRNPPQEVAQHVFSLRGMNQAKQESSTALSRL